MVKATEGAKFILLWTGPGVYTLSDHVQYASHYAEYTQL